MSQDHTTNCGAPRGDPRSGPSRRPRALDVANTLALMGILVTVIYAQVEIGATRQISTLSSLSAIQGDYDESRWRLYLWLAENMPAQDDMVGGLPEDDGSNETRNDRKAAVLRFLTMHLRTIEYGCTVYNKDLVDGEARTRIGKSLTDDITLLLWFYDKEDGVIKMGDADWEEVEWVSAGEPSDDYPETVSCIKELNIVLEPGGF